MRYSALVSFADTADFGSYHVLGPGTKRVGRGFQMKPSMRSRWTSIHCNLSQSESPQRESQGWTKKLLRWRDVRHVTRRRSTSATTRCGAATPRANAICREHRPIQRGRRLLQRKSPLCHERLPDGNKVRIIDREHLNRDPANYASRDQLSSGPCEMLSPLIASRVEQPHDLSGSRVASGNIRTFVPIAVQTGEGEIFEVGRTPMLLRYDVIDVKRQRISRSREPAVFAATIGPAPDLLD